MLWMLYKNVKAFYAHNFTTIFQPSMSIFRPQQPLVFFVSPFLWLNSVDKFSCIALGPMFILKPHIWETSFCVYPFCFLLIVFNMMPFISFNVCASDIVLFSFRTFTIFHGEYTAFIHLYLDIWVVTYHSYCAVLWWIKVCIYSFQLMFVYFGKDENRGISWWYGDYIPIFWHISTFLRNYTRWNFY